MPRGPADWLSMDIGKATALSNLLNGRTRPFNGPEQEPKFSDTAFEWGATTGFKNNDYGSQLPEFARMPRSRFEATMDATSDSVRVLCPNHFDTCIKWTSEDSCSTRTCAAGRVAVRHGSRAHRPSPVGSPVGQQP
jgi:hypothetical protein